MTTLAAVSPAIADLASAVPGAIGTATATAATATTGTGRWGVFYLGVLALYAGVTLVRRRHEDMAFGLIILVVLGLAGVVFDAVLLEYRLSVFPAVAIVGALVALHLANDNLDLDEASLTTLDRRRARLADDIKHNEVLGLPTGRMEIQLKKVDAEIERRRTGESTPAPAE